MNLIEFFLATNQSVNSKYNLISGWFNKIPKRFLCVWSCVFCCMIIDLNHSPFEIQLNISMKCNDLCIEGIEWLSRFFFSMLNAEAYLRLGCFSCASQRLEEITNAARETKTSRHNGAQLRASLKPLYLWCTGGFRRASIKSPWYWETSVSRTAIQSDRCCCSSLAQLRDAHLKRFYER